MSNQERTNRKRLKQCLESMFRHLDRHYNINYGGCCWVTYCLALNFERLGIDFDLIIYDEDEYSAEEAYYTIKERRAGSFPTGDCTAYHYTLRITGMGTLNKSEEHFIKVSGITAEDIYWIYEKGDWNSCYNYRLNNDIKNLIDSTFNIYEQEIGKIAA